MPANTTPIFILAGNVATATISAANTASVGATSIFTFDQPVIMVSGQVMKVVQSVYAGVQDRFDAFAYAGDY